MHEGGDDDHHLESASAGQRLMAAILDFLIILGGLGLVQGLLARLQAGPLVVHGISAGALIAYWVVMPARYGFTPGKYFLNIRIITNDADRHMGLIRMFFREIPGKWLSALIAALGYAMILFGARRALHDRLSGTRVVTTVPLTPLTLMRVMRNAGLSLLLLVAPVAGLAWVLAYTSIPLRQLQENLELQGFTLKSMAGSLAEGVTIRGLRKSDERVEFGADRIFFSVPKEAWLSPVTREVVFGRLEVNGVSARIKQAGLDGITKPDTATPQTPVSPPQSPGAAMGKKEIIKSVRVDLIDATDVNMTWEGMDKVVKFQRFHLKDFYATPTKDFKVGRIYFASDIIDIDTKPIVVTGGRLAEPLTLFGKIKPELAPAVLSGPVDLYATAEGSLKDYRIHLSLGKGALRASASPIRASISMRDFEPRLFLKSAPSLKVEFLEMEAGSPLALLLAPNKATGSLLIADRRFAISPAAGLMGGLSARFDSVDGGYELSPVRPGPGRTAVDSAILMLKAPLKPNQSRTVEEALANLHFGQPVAALRPDQLAVISRERAYFSLKPEVEENPFLRFPAGLMPKANAFPSPPRGPIRNR